LTPASFHAACTSAGASPIKAVLLAGDVVVGAGNIYACEALFQRRHRPAPACHLISRPRAAACWRRCARRWRGAGLGGSTLRDFRDAHGMNGAFQDLRPRCTAARASLSALRRRRCAASCRHSAPPTSAPAASAAEARAVVPA
jgi:hypothetical protein